MLVAALFGMLFGWLGSVPVAGPISALVVTRGIEGRFRSGVYIAVGGAIAEAVYAFLAFWGFSTFLAQYPSVVPISRGIGAVVLGVLGVFMVRGKVSSEAPTDSELRRDTAFRSFILGFWICIINPSLIATWAAVVTGIYSTEAVTFDSDLAAPFAVGSLVGIAGWYFIMLWAIRRFRERFSPATLGKFVRVVGAALCVLSLWFAWRFAEYFLRPAG